MLADGATVGRRRHGRRRLEVLRRSLGVTQRAVGSSWTATCAEKVLAELAVMVELDAERLLDEALLKAQASQC